MTRRWLIPLLLVGLSLMVAAASVAGYVREHRPPTDQQLRAYTEQYPPKGEGVDFWIYTHCGVEHARIGGTWWVAEPPVYGRDGPEVAGPPEGGCPGSRRT